SFPALLVIQRLVNHWISVSQPLDHCPLSRLKSAYAAERLAFVSRFTSTCKPLDQHLLSCAISA
ncbi:hypothetical protein, partial [Klebsiella pneumoniae]|uniref:hypothetical protein n=1 Tax=Klebsiella pneumoniae TaxID=573 RepID=UPI002730D96C